MRLLSHHVAKAGRCLLVSPGESSNHVLDCLGFGHVATVNRAALITPGPIDLASCMDLESLEQIRPAFDRIRSFLVCDRLAIGSKVSGKSWSEIEGVPSERALIYPTVPNTSSAEAIAEAAADPERLATVNSASAALHALGRLGYRQVWVLGCDGGSRYSSLLCHGGRGEDWSGIRVRMQWVANQIRHHHGTEVKFWPERFAE